MNDHPQARGKLIVFEGTDGTGKTTQRDLLGRYLQDKGYPIIITKEPTDGPYGMQIRDLYTHRNKYSREDELSLFLADRREHVADLLLPSLFEGKIILCDRYYFSTAAYQGALGLNPETILTLNDFAPEPDLVLLFQAHLDVGHTRITAGRGETLNNFEQREFLEKVATIFASIKRPYIHNIDASGSIDDVHRLVVGHVIELLQPAFVAAMD
ncbi:MAG: dTMP kinase [Proteobacteria bacterium]|nr:dTMP kinase [Pseudomonadota bacterium]